MVHIKNMTEGAFVDGLYLVNARELRSFKNREGRYLILNVMDRTGTMEARLWTAGEAVYHKIKTGIVVRITGQVKKFNKKLQLEVSEINANTDYDPAEFLLVATGYEKIKKVFLSTLTNISNESGYLGQYIVEEIFGEEFLKQFCLAPAAVKYHHACVGGLMAHTLKVVEVTRRIAPVYPLIDPRLAVIGALLHDIGKVKELQADGTISRIALGSLTGHIVLGCLLVKEKAAKIRQRTDTFTDEIEALLLHIIASHHGRLEYGSPVMPMCPEASIVHYADMLDAEQDKYSEPVEEEGALKYNTLLNREIYTKTQKSALQWDEMPF